MCPSRCKMRIVDNQLSIPELVRDDVNVMGVSIKYLEIAYQDNTLRSL